jgi:hypothetical protein
MASINSDIVRLQDGTELIKVYEIIRDFVTFYTLNVKILSYIVNTICCLDWEREVSVYKSDF